MCGYLDFIEQQAVCQSNISALRQGNLDHLMSSKMPSTLSNLR